MNINLHQQLKILINSTLLVKPVATGLNCAETSNPVSYTTEKVMPSSSGPYHLPGFLSKKRTDPVQTSTAVNINAHIYEWLNMLITSMPHATLVTDSLRNIIITNQQFCQLFHLPQSPQQLANRNSLDLLGELSSDMVDAMAISGRINELYDSREPADNDEIHLKDGRIIVRGHRPLYFQNEFFGHLWTYADETERILARQKLNEQRDFYETILNSLSTEIAVFSPDQRYQFVNPAAIKDVALRNWMMGKTDADFCVFRGKDIAVTEDRRNAFKKVQAEGKSYTWLEKQITTTQPERSVLRTLSPVYNPQGELEIFIAHSLDVTEQESTKEQALLNEVKYKDLFNYSQELICMHDLNGNIEKANPALCAVMEMPANALIGKNLKDFLPEQDHHLFTDTYLPTIKTGNRAKGLFRFNTHSGRRIYLLFQNYKIVHPEGDMAPYVISFAQDVTNRIQAERQLKEAKKIVEETARVKEKFLTNMSHEIRVPMTRIKDLTAQLINNVPALRQQPVLDKIQQSSEHILNILEDILDLEKVNTGEIVFDHIPFDVATRVHDTITLYKEIAENKNIDFAFDNRLPPEYVAIGDAGRLAQVLENLVGNAVKFTHEGAISICAQIENESTFDVTLHFSVKDTGIGIDEDKLIKIFQPFIQAHDSRKKQYAGAGLGLALTKKLISLQNGTIWVESRPKKGSTFHFNIVYQKFSDPETLPNDKKSISVVNRLGNLKVLLAEDNAINQLLARSVIQYLGFESKTASNGQEAIELLEKEDFDIVLMDIQMPVKDGVEATTYIRSMADSKKKNIPIIALTASTLKGEESRYLAAGMNAFIPKPFKEEDLYDIIEKVLADNNNGNSNENA
ncbi:PAS domain S-box-containing protein [Filimonas lacunae]|uniref:histidine kinase n=1 Tax=Filimonas lacunae TaxID=477680 RepID=A0A173MMX5_9BACT|nr:PAS domain-containing hybrid sensor histidine kinase/response regulator [Filimonas lacunae]BAV08819.1 sensory box histidine kinase/response regulator [Filimonas lacunae]SIS62226.1 PAS domain S-box-containing protein [Filimonas lacunae]